MRAVKGAAADPDILPRRGRPHPLIQFMRNAPPAPVVRQRRRRARRRARGTVEAHPDRQGAGGGGDGCRGGEATRHDGDGAIPLNDELDGAVERFLVHQRTKATAPRASNLLKFEARTRFELAYDGFANRCLTTWLPRRPVGALTRAGSHPDGRVLHQGPGRGKRS